jgi:HNH endonuclease
VISGKEAKGAAYNSWTGFEAAHIFPLAHEGHWRDYNYDRWISLLPETGGPINSVQNGLLLRSDIHQLFDSYDFSINPDVYLTLRPS